MAGTRKSPSRRRTRSSRNLARAPMRLLPLGGRDEGFDLRRQLVGVADRATRPVAQRLQAVILIPIEDLVTGLARNAELATHLAHAVAFQKAGDKAQTLVHNRTLLPGHRRLLARLPQRKSVTHVSGTNCHPCLGPLTCVLRHIALKRQSEGRDKCAAERMGRALGGHSSASHFRELRPKRDVEDLAQIGRFYRHDLLAAVADHSPRAASVDAFKPKLDDQARVGRARSASLQPVVIAGGGGRRL